jgi:hypothetical protein
MVMVEHFKSPTYHTIPSMKDSARKKEINQETSHLHTKLIISIHLQKQLSWNSPAKTEILMVAML